MHPLELFDQGLVDLVAKVLDCAALAVHHDRLVEVRELALGLGVDADLGKSVTNSEE
jgi:hypothetical protein